jgi:hypothetical protein
VHATDFREVAFLFRQSAAEVDAEGKHRPPHFPAQSPLGESETAILAAGESECVLKGCKKENGWTDAAVGAHCMKGLGLIVRMR